MTPKALRILRTSLGLSQSDLAGRFEVTPRTVRRWEQEGSEYSPPVAVQERLQAQWGLYADRVAETLEIARERGTVQLLTYTDEVECITDTGLTLSEYDALLGHMAMALTCAHLDYSLREH